MIQLLEGSNFYLYSFFNFSTELIPFIMDAFFWEKKA